MWLLRWRGDLLVPLSFSAVPWKRAMGSRQHAGTRVLGAVTTSYRLSLLIFYLDLELAWSICATVIKCHKPDSL